MPNIVEYNATGEITPSDRGIQAAEFAGRHLEAQYDKLGAIARQVGDQVEKHMAVMETSEIYKTTTEAEYNLQKQIDEEAPKHQDDPHWFDVFREQTIKPTIERISRGPKTEEGKRVMAARADSMLTNLTRHGMGAQAANDWAHVQTNDIQTLNNIAATAADSPTVDGLNKGLGAYDQYAKESTSHISDPEMAARTYVEKAREGKPKIVVEWYKGQAFAGARQYGETGGKAPALDQLEDNITKEVGFDLLDSDQRTEVKSLLDKARQEGMERFRTNTTWQQKQEDDNVEKVILQGDLAMYKPDGQGGVTVEVPPDALTNLRQAASMPGAERKAPEIKAQLNALNTITQDHMNHKDRVTDHSAYMSLFSRVGSTADPLTKVEVDKLVDKLSDKDYATLRGMASDSKQANPRINHAITELNHQLTLMKPLIVKSNFLGTEDPEAAARFAAFSWHAQDRLLKAIHAMPPGGNPDKIVHYLTDPNNHVGLYHDMQTGPYLSDNKSALQNVIKATNPITGGGTLPAVVGGHEPPPALPDEDPAAYRKRTGQ